MNLRTIRLGSPCALLFLAAATSAAAQVEIDKQQPAPAPGEVYIENYFGSIEVTGWEREVVRVTGRLAAGAEGIDVDSDEDGVGIDVEVPEAWLYASESDDEYRSELTVQVPQGSSIYVETLNATIVIRGIQGHVEVETINGPVTVEGDPRSVEIESMTGSVQVRARAAEMEVESISGPVDLAGVTKSVGVTTVSGSIRVRGEALEEVELEAVTGDVAFDGSFVAEGGLELETHSGNVELSLPADVKARFECETFSGSIENAFGAKPTREGRFHPFQQLRFSTGLEEFTVQIRTYSGNIALRKRGAERRP